MYTIYARNVNEALPIAVGMFRQDAAEWPSRNGPMFELPRPVTTHFVKSRERVLFSARRDANPFFHFFEALWMLAGRCDVAFVTQFNKRMATYSDDKKTFHAAYGHRWRYHFKMDQVDQIIAELKTNPLSRRLYISMWDPQADLGQAKNDLPCNVGIAFSNRGSDLSMTVFNRSNDLLWGAYGANVVHMSMLQEYIAGRAGLHGVGSYYQVSNSLHVYPDNPVFHEVMSMDPGPDDPYERGEVAPYPMFEEGVPPEDWDTDLTRFFHAKEPISYSHSFFRRVVTPLWAAWWAYKDKKNPERFYVAHKALEQCLATDWRRAAREWLLRREANLSAKEAEHA